jgi:hypothetical protein
VKECPIIFAPYIATNGEWELEHYYTHISLTYMDKSFAFVAEIENTDMTFSAGNTGLRNLPE